MSAWCCAAAKQANAAKMTSRLIFSLFGSRSNVGLEFGEGVCGAASRSPEVGWNVWEGPNTSATYGGEQGLKFPPNLSPDASRTCKIT